MLTFHPVLPMRAAMVAAVATALGILALANLTSVPPRAVLAQERQIRAPTAASIGYSRDSRRPRARRFGPLIFWRTGFGIKVRPGEL